MPTQRYGTAGAPEHTGLCPGQGFGREASGHFHGQGLPRGSREQAPAASLTGGMEATPLRLFNPQSPTEEEQTGLLGKAPRDLLVMPMGEKVNHTCPAACPWAPPMCLGFTKSPGALVKNTLQAWKLIQGLRGAFK